MLNPGQIPAITMDHPLFALAKTIQWSFLNTHGEDQFLIMSGGLHIEMAAFKVLGNWLEGSGWTTAITNAEIATSGVADSFLKASHLTKTRHAHPAVYQEFLAGGFVAFKTMRPFSAMALDQTHEQSNAVIKGDGGAVGLTENTSALTRWTMAGPEISRMIEEYEMLQSTANTSPRHHDQYPAVQLKFQREVTQLISVISDLGNPFTEDRGNLLTIDTKEIMDQVVVESVKQVIKLGKEQYSKFHDERLVKRSVPINEPIKRNKLSLFKTQKFQISRNPR